MTTRCIVALIAAANAATHTRQSFKSSFISLGGVKHHVRDTGEVSADGPVAILLHGFAGSGFNCWRSTLPALATTHRVYALDLLGLGASAQPDDVTYSIDLVIVVTCQFRLTFWVCDGDSRDQNCFKVDLYPLAGQL